MNDKDIRQSLAFSGFSININSPRGASSFLRKRNVLIVPKIYKKTYFELLKGGNKKDMLIGITISNGRATANKN